MAKAEPRRIACAFRRAAPAALLAAALWLALPAAPRADEVPGFLRIGTGEAASTEFQVGSALAGALRAAFDAEDCTDPPCPAEAPLPVAQLSSGAFANVADLAAGRLEAALVQADIAHWAFNGGGAYPAGPAGANLRAVANLHPQTLHVIVSGRGSIGRLRDLRGLRVALGERGSGAGWLAGRVLAAHGLGRDDLEARDLAPGLAVERLAAGKLDAVFVLGGVPVSAVVGLADIAEVRLLAVDAGRLAPEADGSAFFAPATVPAGAYRSVEETATVAVAAQLLVRADLPDELVYRLTAGLWRPESLARLAAAHPQGAAIRPETALTGLTLPLHPGAERYYREAGLLE
jgi:TRAP transporter TAXI family solute receptor